MSGPSVAAPCDCIGRTAGAVGVGRVPWQGALAWLDRCRRSQTMDSRDAQIAEALGWVVETLHQAGAPYQVVGGLAAIAHGATRPLNDIDLYAPLWDPSHDLATLRRHATWGPQRYRDDDWDLVFMKLQVAGVQVEIGDSHADPMFYDRQAARWVQQTIDFDGSVPKRIFGVEVDVMPVDDLLAYKRALGRAVDAQDVREVERARAEKPHRKL